MTINNSNVDNGFESPASGTTKNAPFVNDKRVAVTIEFGTPVAGASTVTTIPITVKDGRGTAMDVPTLFDLWLSDAADGEGLTATTASGAVAAAASGGTIIGTGTTKKAFRCQTKDNGTFTLSITDSAKTAFRLAAATVYSGETFVSAALATGDYGA